MSLTFAFLCGTVGILLTEMATWPIFVMHCPNRYPFINFPAND